MSQEYETKEVTKTETLYKAYHFDSINNEIIIIWQKTRPFKVETTLELAKEFLKKEQQRTLKRKTDNLKEAEFAVAQATTEMLYWENLVNTEPKVVDKTNA